MINFFLIILVAFIFSLLEGCCKYTVTEKELHIHFSNDYSPSDTIIISYNQEHDNQVELENIVIGDDRSIILNENFNSNFGYVDTMIIEIKSKNIKDTLTNFQYSAKEKDVFGCASADIEIFGFEKDSVKYSPANIIQINY
ncbi:MAG: hypothetical protein J7604_07650 [Sporocytophaga sp.]|uniref:hypothetical protein n=1 Tax=Sporocytophaga sp. TaxID=2231183 RepID=UPI001B10036D|nr:hypothetical protein [Sporocytophaga sp.]MBO9700070.1 hypothetical protein [Sporocytophaga sp.]